MGAAALLAIAAVGSTALGTDWIRFAEVKEGYHLYARDTVKKVSRTTRRVWKKFVFTEADPRKQVTGLHLYDCTERTRKLIQGGVTYADGHVEEEKGWEEARHCDPDGWCEKLLKIICK